MRKSRRSFIFDLTVFFGSLAVLGYFGWHGFYGSRSINHAKTVQASVTQVKEELLAVNDARDKLDSRVALLRPQTIDPDMLDEMARKTLQFSKKTEIIVPKPQN